MWTSGYDANTTIQIIHIYLSHLVLFDSYLLETLFDIVVAQVDWMWINGQKQENKRILSIVQFRGRQFNRDKNWNFGIFFFFLKNDHFLYWLNPIWWPHSSLNTQILIEQWTKMPSFDVNCYNYWYLLFIHGCRI